MIFVDEIFVDEIVGAFTMPDVLMLDATKCVACKLTHTALVNRQLFPVIPPVPMIPVLVIELLVSDCVALMDVAVTLAPFKFPETSPVTLPCTLPVKSPETFPVK